MRFMMRRRPTSTRCSWSWTWKARSTARRWRRAAQALIARHASLRAGFRHDDLERPVQVIVPQAAAPWRMVDLSALEEADRARAS